MSSTKYVPNLVYLGAACVCGVFAGFIALVMHGDYSLVGEVMRTMLSLLVGGAIILGINLLSVPLTRLWDAACFTIIETYLEALRMVENDRS